MAAGNIPTPSTFVQKQPLRMIDFLKYEFLFKNITRHFLSVVI